MRQTPSPLLGDGRGVFRIHVVGNAGSGKSTLSRELARILNIPYICLDELFWKPGFEMETAEQFRVNVANALANCPNGWVVDGDFRRRISDIVDTQTTDEIWLDLPLALYLPRLTIRTLARLFGLAEPCRPGCEETLSVFFSRENMIWWCITNHGVVRQREAARYEKMGREEGTDVENRKMRRIGGWGGQLRAWLEEVRDMRRGH
ncbi:hypothetical protein MIND_00214200 [Mycena indigotica]|uniref:Adenylate kinase n=1 Tax=Mycena indigotica TaxID=2126181 RepID=A0A8H6T800_9AGAR|nr:uncharacterized protein MIND_00214200 [Mycena indigotica]KAF7312022.1 hypothetical protein MIND_00214200 [Mycena indigotica]